MKCIYSVNSTVFSESEYVFYYLEELLGITKDIYVCINSSAEQEIKDKFASYELPVFEYDTMIDVNRWKDVIVNHMNQDDLIRAKELLLVNDSMFGPFYSLASVFDEMRTRKTDFWGMTKHSSIKLENTVYPAFLQTYFMCFNRKILSSDAFMKYWKRLPKFESFDDAAVRFEFSFTGEMAKLGFKYDAFVDTSDIERDNPEFYLSFILFNINNLVSARRYPFIPKFVFDIEKREMLNFHDGDDVRKVLEFVKNEYSYDIGMIYRNIVKRGNLGELLNRLNLHFVVGDNKEEYNKTSQTHAVFAYLYYEDLFDYCLGKLFATPDDFAVYVATDSAKKAQILTEKIAQMTTRVVKVVVTGGRGRDVASLLVTFRKEIGKYDIVGFIHDKKSGQLNYQTVGDAYNQHLWENMISSQAYVENVMNTFEKHPEIGFLSPDAVTYGNYFHVASDAWTICYERCLELAGRMNLGVNISDKNNPVSLGTCFYARSIAIKKLLDLELNYEDFPEEPLAVDGTVSHAIERVIPYVAQSEGYLSGYISSIKNAEAELVRNEYMLNKLLAKLKNNTWLDYSTFNNMINSMGVK